MPEVTNFGLITDLFPQKDSTYQMVLSYFNSVVFGF